MSNETFLISIKQNNDLSGIAVEELRADCMQHPLNQQKYIRLAALPGNAAKYGVKQTETQVGPLLNKEVFFLGSSVTLGYGALGESFVDYLWKADGVFGTKDAVNGATLVGKLHPSSDNDSNFNPDSYVVRLKGNIEITREHPESKPEAVVLQLSTNDASKNKQLGEISNDNHFDTETITGALEYILSNVQSNWSCPILVFTNPYFDNPLYGKMVQRLYELEEKYHFSILDLYNDPNFKNQDSLYMADQIHPTRAGYKKKWLPLFEKELIKILQ